MKPIAPIEDDRPDRHPGSGPLEASGVDGAGVACLSVARLVRASRRALALVTLAPLLAAGQGAAQMFKDVDLPLGEKLIRENRCSECHSRKVGGDGSALYRPQGRINTPGSLRGMVEQCNLDLNLALFPDEVNAIAAVLNRDHYRFK